MSICSKCEIDKEVDNFYTYFHSTRKKQYTRRICNDCFRKGQKKQVNIKLIQLPQQETIVEPVVLELEPGYKQCHTCNEVKPISEYYNSHYKNPIRNCKTCYKKYHRDKVEQQMEDKGGVDTYKSNPNEYTNETQREQVFMVMEVCGWTYNDNGVWSKPGIKTKDNVWECFEESTKLKRKGSPNSGRKIKKGVWNCVDDIVKRIESGERYSDIADIYECSHTTLRTIISNYRNGIKERTD